ncbi:DUF3168 domain-containing protein [Methyloligella sp. 2.7D]|uniref:DUF3168 domain-containing protein n=1 Tax=unclassified Methyloligella TaxID=2625955 RepID=UPI00157C5266|nr:DUF3168 domain-containing protein [Methyloligella sp. GL2]QKP77115.1 DUF3168 domain-containing protein [Methyloligella sp. GL2]
MTASPAWSLQTAIYETLSGSSGLTDMLGGIRIYDDPPQSAAFPFVTIGESSVVDWSTGTEDGAEHLVTLHVWSRAGGKKQGHEIVEAIRALLHDRALMLDGHVLVNLRYQFSETRQDPDGESYHGIVRYRAVTEPAAAIAA